MLDQELSLFYDSGPCLALEDLHCLLPSPEHQWLASTYEEWVRVMLNCPQQSEHNGVSYQAYPTRSIYTLYHDFVDGRLPEAGRNLTPMELRMLLHPIQAEVFLWRRKHACLTALGRNLALESQMKPAVLKHRAELASQLSNWCHLAYSHLERNKTCSVTRCSLVMFHLISLNLATNFREIESLAQYGNPDVAPLTFYFTKVSGVQDDYMDSTMRGRIVYHCGQVFYLLQSEPPRHRPSWWTAALYRATLILWADTLFHTNPLTTNGDPSPDLWTIDLPHQDIDNVVTQIQQGRISPCLQMDQGTRTLNTPSTVLEYAIEKIGAADSSRFGDGIRRKLYALRSNWAHLLTAAFGGQWT